MEAQRKKLVRYKEMLAYAQEHHFTVAGMNAFNLETVRAVITAADEKDTPIIVQVYHSDLHHPTPQGMYALCSTFANEAKVDVALGLDHGESFEQAKLCIENGFTGVMIDLASENYDYNVQETKRVVEFAHARGVSVEAELGTISTGEATHEEIQKGFTDPQLARKFALETGIDCLAVSIGTVHGPYFRECKIDFNLLQELLEQVPCPIVVHGGSGTPEEDVARMVRMGIAKLNIGTDLFQTYTKVLYGTGIEPGEPWVHPVTSEDAAFEAVRQEALRKLEILTRYRR